MRRIIWNNLRAKIFFKWSAVIPEYWSNITSMNDKTIEFAEEIPTDSLSKLDSWIIEFKDGNSYKISTFSYVERKNEHGQFCIDSLDYEIPRGERFKYRRDLYATQYEGPLQDSRMIMPMLK